MLCVAPVFAFLASEISLIIVRLCATFSSFLGGIMKRIVLVGLSAVTLAGCGDGSSSSASSEPSESEMIARYQVMSKDKLKESLRDPGSAKFEDVGAHRVASGGFVFCGRMNAKNGFGGYTGFERFVASPVIVGTEGTVDGFEEVWTEFCSPTSRVQSVWF